MTHLTYTFAQLCDQCQFSSPRTARRILKSWAEHGFPQRLPSSQALWSKAAVDNWLQVWPKPKGPTAAPSTIHNLRAELAQEYGIAS